MKLIDFKSLGPSKGINYSRDHLRRKTKAGEFPKPVALSDSRIAWREDEVDEWLASSPDFSYVVGFRAAVTHPSAEPSKRVVVVG